MFITNNRTWQIIKKFQNVMTIIQSHHQLHDALDVTLLKRNDYNLVMTIILAKFNLAFYVFSSSCNS